MKGWSGRFLAVLAVAVVALVPVAGPALAEAGDGFIPRIDVQIAVQPDGQLLVTETIDYTFTDQSHGIIRLIPVRYDYLPDPDFQRVIEISELVVTSPSGAPDDVQASEEGDYLQIRVGDPDVTVAGAQQYRLRYLVTGALNHFDSHEELYWNAIGDEWTVPLGRGVVEATAPAVSDGLCFRGPPGSTLPCQELTVGDEIVTARQDLLGYGSGMTVVVAMPVGSVEVPPPILEERWSLRRAFSFTPATGGVALGLLAAGGVAVGAMAVRRGRDRRFVDQVPGLEPVPGVPSREEIRPYGAPVEGPVEWSPPEGMRPGLVGTLQDETANVLDVTATIVDLAVRGYLRIDEMPRSSLFGKRDWQLVQLKPEGPELLQYERSLFSALFQKQSTVTLSGIKMTFHESLTLVQSQLYDEMLYRRWYRRRPDTTRTAWFGAGFLAVAAAVGVTYLLARFTTFGLAGLALVLVALGLLAAARAMPARTGEGSAALARVLGFKRYIATAEANQLKWEEAESIFSRYLPYAIVFGLADHWASVFKQLAAASGIALPAVVWYTGPHGWTDNDFSDSISAFSTTTAGSLSATASSGGSGFGGGGGFSGGGFGGGGGGGW